MNKGLAPSTFTISIVLCKKRPTQKFSNLFLWSALLFCLLNAAWSLYLISTILFGAYSIVPWSIKMKTLIASFILFNTMVLSARTGWATRSIVGPCEKSSKHYPNNRDHKKIKPGKVWVSHKLRDFLNVPFSYCNRLGPQMGYLSKPTVILNIIISKLAQFSKTDLTH